MRRVGVIMSLAANDPELELRRDAFVQALQQAGWTVGRNLRIDTRWSSGTAEDVRRSTREVLGFSPEVVLAGGRAAVIVPEIQQAGRGIPIVFVQAVDPVGTGYVARLTRPGGDATGFMQLEYTLSKNGCNCSRTLRPARNE